ncbi:SDR family NAD(P)-dependent oxidoreductase [Pseudonocardia sp. NPDC049154]|uniref:SDR family oxidoreductase n=1 Tax=Pseudonocardia sp. NPDC049154 TaxID=3155501 RepID=UPI0033D22E9D
MPDPHLPVTDRYRGKVAVVTGGASGIGAAIVRRLHAEGALVVAGDLNADLLARLADELDERLVAFPMDVTDEAAVVGLVDRAVTTGVVWTSRSTPPGWAAGARSSSRSSTPGTA